MLPHMEGQDSSAIRRQAIATPVGPTAGVISGLAIARVCRELRGPGERWALLGTECLHRATHTICVCK